MTLSEYLAAGGLAAGGAALLGIIAAGMALAWQQWRKGKDL